MAKLDASMIADKHKRRMAAAGQDYDFGVRNPKRSWQDGMNSSIERIKAELMRAIQEGRIEKGVAKAGNEKWVQGVQEVGRSRFTQSAERASARYAERASDIVAASEASQAAAQRLPGTTQEERIQKAVAAMQATSRYWKDRG